MCLGWFPKRAAVGVDVHESTVEVAYRLTEALAIYPSTSSSPMAEHSEEWSARQRPNLWGTVPRLVQMQSEGGAPGALHGMLQAGAMCATFTASQGLLLMNPNMYRRASGLLPFCMHVTAPTVATHALSIFGDHLDVMAFRGTGVAMLSAASVQEAQDFALVAHAATPRARVRFLPFFDGFRTSHEISKIVPLSDETLRDMGDEGDVAQFRDVAPTPDHPRICGTPQNSDTFFEASEASNVLHDSVAGVVSALLGQLQKLPGRHCMKADVKSTPFLEPLYEYSGACSGCGETRYLKLPGQMYGDRLYMANATGCFSTYGGNLTTTPNSVNADGRSPAWSNSLFEDNAEYGLGLRVAVDKHAEQARKILQRLAPRLGDSIGVGGLDHVLFSGRDVNLLVMDTEVYSHSGGQASKATPLGAAAKFASSGKITPKIDLGPHPMMTGGACVARTAFGAMDSQTVQASSPCLGWRKIPAHPVSCSFETSPL